MVFSGSLHVLEEYLHILSSWKKKHTFMTVMSMLPKIKRVKQKELLKLQKCKIWKKNHFNNYFQLNWIFHVLHSPLVNNSSDTHIVQSHSKTNILDASRNLMQPGVQPCKRRYKRYVTDFYTLIMYVNSFGSFKIYIPIKNYKITKAKSNRTIILNQNHKEQLFKEKKVEVSKKTEMNINNTL